MEGASEIGAAHGPNSGIRSLLSTGRHLRPPAPTSPEPDNINKVHRNSITLASLTRIMRRIIPSRAKISDEAKETMRECVAEFISFITTEANDRCFHEHRKILTAEDILWALYNLGLEDYIEPLTRFLEKYRESEGGFRGRVQGPPVIKNSVATSALAVSSGERIPQLFHGVPPPTAQAFSFRVSGGAAEASCSSLVPDFDPFSALGGNWGGKVGGDQAGGELDGLCG